RRPTHPPIRVRPAGALRHDPRDRLEPAAVPIRRSRVRAHGRPMAVARVAGNLLRGVPPASNRGSHLGLAAVPLDPAGARGSPHALAVCRAACLGSVGRQRAGSADLRVPSNTVDTYHRLKHRNTAMNSPSARSRFAAERCSCRAMAKSWTIAERLRYSLFVSKYGSDLS